MTEIQRFVGSIWNECEPGEEGQKKFQSIKESWKNFIQAIEQNWRQAFIYEVKTLFSWRSHQSSIDRIYSQNDYTRMKPLIHFYIEQSYWLSCYLTLREISKQNIKEADMQLCTIQKQSQWLTFPYPQKNHWIWNNCMISIFGMGLKPPPPPVAPLQSLIFTWCPTVERNSRSYPSQFCICFKFIAGETKGETEINKR